MALNLGTNVGSAVVPYDSADIYPSHKAQFGLGGYRCVANAAARNLIPSAAGGRCETGMLVRTLDDGKIWILNAGFHNPLVDSDWTEMAGGANDGGVGLANLVSNGDFLNWTAGAAAAPDDWLLSGAGAAVARNAGVVKIGSYSARVTRNGADANIYQNIHVANGIDYWKGRQVTFSCWVYCSVADRARLRIWCSFLSSFSSDYHTGSGDWELLSVSFTVPGTATGVSFELQVNDGDTLAYFDGAQCVEGDQLFAFTRGPISDFLRLTDTPNTYTGQAGTVPAVDSTETALEFVGALPMTFYVDPSLPVGVGESGSALRPFRTFAAAAAVAPAGSKIIVMTSAGSNMGNMTLTAGYTYEFMTGTYFNGVITLSGAGMFTIYGEEVFFSNNASPMFTIGAGQTLRVHNLKILGASSQDIFYVNDASAVVECFGVDTQCTNNRIVYVVNGEFYSDRDCRFVTGNANAVRIDAGIARVNGIVENNAAALSTIYNHGGTLHLDAESENLNDYTVLSQDMNASITYMSPNCRTIGHNNVTLVALKGFAYWNGYVENNSAVSVTSQIGDGAAGVAYVDIMSNCVIFNQSTVTQLLLTGKGATCRMHAGCRLDGHVAGTYSLNKDDADSGLYIVPCCIKEIIITGSTNILPGYGAIFTYGSGNPDGADEGVPGQIYIDQSTGLKYVHLGPIGGTDWQLLT